MSDINGQVAWVTGAASGIGASTALGLAGAGMRLVLSDLREEGLARVAAQIADRGGRSRVAPLDVSDARAVQAVADGIAREEERIDVVVNCAGVNVERRNWKHLAREDWDKIVRVDLDGAFYCCHAVLPMMRAQKGGLIVNVSSWAGKQVIAASGPAYTAAKFGVCAFTESINLEEGLHGIRATVICPAEVNSPFLDKRPVPLTAGERSRMVQTDDLGELVVFLARLPAHVCINEVTISPTRNAFYMAQARTIPD